MARRRPFSAKGRAAAVLVAAGAIAVVAAIWPDMPRWTRGGARMVAVTPLEAIEPAGVTATSGAIVVQGDSHTTGARMGPGGADLASHAFPAILARELGADDRLVVRGQGGDTAGEGRRRWATAPIRGGIALILFGTNDAALRGPLARRAATPLPIFEADLAALVGRAQEGGAVPVILAPIPAGSPAMSRRLQPYRAASRRVAARAGAGFLDPAEAFARCGDAGPLLLRDALHLNRTGHACLGRWLAQRLADAGLVSPVLDRGIPIGHAPRP